jgi:hypothetical protein
MEMKMEMELRSGWLERSLERARTNIQERPDRLKPEKYRAKRTAPAPTRKRRASTGN